NPGTAESAPSSKPEADPAVAHRLNEARLAVLDTVRLRREFVSQGAFLYLSEFLAPEVTAPLIAAGAGVEPAINRNYLPGHKQGGSVSRHTIDQLAPFIAGVYRSKALIGWLRQVGRDARVA